MLTDISVLFQLLYNSAMENACSELGARMSSMDNSSKNAGEMLDRLTLSYNRSVPLPLSLVYILLGVLKF